MVIIFAADAGGRVDLIVFTAHGDGFAGALGHTHITINTLVINPQIVICAEGFRYRHEFLPAWRGRHLCRGEF